MFGFRSRQTLEIEVKQGARGRWRWIARRRMKDGSVVMLALSPVHGYKSKVEAAAVAVMLFRKQWRIKVTYVA